MSLANLNATESELKLLVNVSGEVLTFYSTKMGVGRSMSLASIACILARKGKRVLVIDWDFDNPTIYQYLTLLSPESKEQVKSSPGLIELCWDVMRMARGLRPKQIVDVTSENNFSILSAHITSASLGGSFINDGKVDIMMAGRQDRKFNVRVRYFSWSDFYDRCDGTSFFNAMFDWMVAEYDYVLIDSLIGRFRSSFLFPFLRTDKLVVCFTLDEDSVNTSVSAAGFIKRRAGAALRVYPVPMRVVSSELEIRERREASARTAFAPYLAHLPESEVKRYWRSVENPEIPYYLYARELPPLREGPEGSLSAAYEQLITYLTDASLTGSGILTEQVTQREMSRLDRRGSAEEGGKDWNVYARPYEGEGDYGFVSYARDDGDLVLPIVQDIDSLDYHLWWDEGIPGATEWLAYLEEKIKQSNYVILFLSRRAVVSDWVKREIEIARHNGKPIIVIRLDKSDLPQSIEEVLGGYQMLDISTVAFEENLAETLRLIYSGFVPNASEKGAA